MLGTVGPIHRSPEAVVMLADMLLTYAADTAMLDGHFVGTPSVRAGMQITSTKLVLLAFTHDIPVFQWLYAPR